MTKIKVDFLKTVGKIKPMHAVNNGPMKKRAEQCRSNFESFKSAKIPYVRNHDASFLASYGGEHTVDVHAIFPDFNANPYDERSYDFQLTDEYTQTIVNSGAEVFYRLGSKIEHWSKQYGTVVPADFKKWAVICEHIIRHYTEGWANGFHHKITYWEIWNEADGIALNGAQPNWTGTPEEYYELYVTAAAHLKKRFPHLKIGGPALSWVEHTEWVEGFLSAIKNAEEDVPLDFFSWHEYSCDVAKFSRYAMIIRETLDRFGFTDTESILNEYNYVENWTDKFVSSVLAIISERGAAFFASIMLKFQKLPVDMLMYYDARPCTFNGLFDFYTLKPLKSYYALTMFSQLYEMENEVYSQSDDEDVYVCAAADGENRAIMISYYTAERTEGEKEIVLDINGDDCRTGYLIDKDNTMTELKLDVVDGKIKVVLKADSVMLIK